MGEGLEEMKILSDVVAESIELEIAGGERDCERSVHSEDRFPAELDPATPREADLAVDRHRRRRLRSSYRHRFRRRRSPGRVRVAANESWEAKKRRRENRRRRSSLDQAQR